ncbi:MAG: carboxypeptidase regulatory-like domain-containing protein [Pirellulales bacterium]|nr:carboxypeptidase regulatory-like domain-containing protein [Pirellulales bacterium]
MADNSRSAAGRRNWRQKAPAAPTGGGAKMGSRIVFSLLGMGLIGLFVWLIWWWFFLPKTYFACLPIVNYGVLAVPPIAFAEEDASAFPEIGPPERTLSLSDFEISKNIAALSEGLQKFPMRPRDVLILSITAHGVSDNGVAYLLSSDYSPRPDSPDIGRRKLSDLLDRLCESPAGTKLLILDANHLEYDPRLGMVANEFPRLLAEEVKKMTDPSVWMLASAGPMQLSQKSPDAKRSLFSEAVTKGLCGAADENNNRTIELDELYRYVREQVPKLAGPIAADAQSPQLLHGGAGLADPPAKIALTSYSTKKDASDSQENPPPDKKIVEERAKLKKTLQRAWALRDEIQDRGRGDGWTPIDYAPHLWREFQTLLLGYERRSLCGNAFSAAKLAEELQQEIDAWQKAAQNSAALSNSEKQSVLGRLTSVRRDFTQNNAKKSWDRNDPRARAFKKAFQLKNDLAFWAPYYLRYHAIAPISSDSLYEPLNRLLQQLQALSGVLENRLNERVAVGSAGEYQNLETNSKECDRLWKDIKSRIPAAEVNALTETLRPKTARARIEALLATPLPSAADRTRLLEILESPKKSVSETAETRNAPGDNAAIPNLTLRWRRLYDQAGLERHLALLADPALKNFPLKEVSLDDSKTENLLWLAFRQLGNELGDFYAELPGRIENGLDSSNQSDLRKTERLLRVLDGRDAQSIDSAKALSCTVPPIPEPPPPPPELTIAVSDDKPLALPRKGARPQETLPFDLNLQSSVPISATVQVALQFEGELIEIVNLENNRPIRPGDAIPVTFDRESSKSLKLQARAMRQSDFKAEVNVEAVLDKRSARKTIPFHLASPDVVDLTILAFGHPIGQSSSSADEMRLWPYPNRTTNYTLALVNRSGRARNVLVELFALAAPQRERNLKGSPADILKMLKPDLISLTGPTPLEVSLPADDAPVTITFPKPQSAADEKEQPKAPEKPKPDNPGGQNPAEKAKPLAELTHGMVCAIRDAETKEPRWLKRIDCSPRKPRDYLRPEVSYDAARKRVSIRVAADEALNPPPLSPENPLPIVWADAGEAANSEAKITQAGQSAELFARVESAPNKKVSVQLAVDGYPRAFVYEVRCDGGDAQPIQPERVEIRILSPAADKPFKVPLAEPIPLKFQADAPEDAFQRAANSVQVSILAENSDSELVPGEHRRFHSDRQAQVYLNEFAPSGELKIGTKVGDFEVPLNVGGLKNMFARIAVRIEVRNPNLPQGEMLRKDSVRILLQADPPTLEGIVAPIVPIPLGRPIEAGVIVEKSYSDIKEMQIGVDRNDSGELEESDAPKKLTRPGDDGKWRVALPTEGLQARRYALLAKATDVLGFSSKAIAKTVTIDPSADASDKKIPAASTISGRVIDQEGKPLAKIGVALRGTDFSATTDAGGNFTFKDVPHGKYTIEARGSVIGSERSAAQEVTLPGASETFKVVIRLAW